MNIKLLLLLDSPAIEQTQEVMIKLQLNYTLIFLFIKNQLINVPPAGPSETEGLSGPPRGPSGRNKNPLPEVE